MDFSTPEGPAALAEALKKNSTLTQLRYAQLLFSAVSIDSPTRQPKRLSESDFPPRDPIWRRLTAVGVLTRKFDM